MLTKRMSTFKVLGTNISEKKLHWKIHKKLKYGNNVKSI